MSRRVTARLVVALTASVAGIVPSGAVEVYSAKGLRDGDTIVRLPGIEGGIGQTPSAVGVRAENGSVRRVVLVDGALALARQPEPKTPEDARPADILADG